MKPRQQADVLIRAWEAGAFDAQMEAWRALGRDLSLGALSSEARTEAVGKLVVDTLLAVEEFLGEPFGRGVQNLIYSSSYQFWWDLRFGRLQVRADRLRKRQKNRPRRKAA